MAPAGRVVTRLLAVGLGIAILPAAACSRSSSGSGASPDASASAATASVASISPVDSASAGQDDDAVRPVYPIDDKPPLPQAIRYCEVVQDRVKKRREACCPGAPSFALTAECVRTLSVALRAGTVALADADLDACERAVNAETAGCDWVTSVGTPTAAGCLGILHGTVKAGGACRSSLECADGAFCAGLGATRGGRCAAPSPARSICGTGTDSLAAFTGQDDSGRRHPECAGYCASRQCRDAVAVGEACTTAVACGPGARCIGGKCSTGDLPAAGKACTEVCAPGARCVKGTCAATKAEGEPCASDTECRVACARDDAGAGRCGPQCPSLLLPKK
jgi:hypothetical protein